MAQNVNVVVITGNLTRDPEQRQTRNDSSVCSMRVAVNGRRKDSASGEWVDDPNYFDVTAFGRVAENCVRYLSKGRPVAVHGRLDWSEWETPEGQKRSAVKIIASEVQFLGGREESTSIPLAEFDAAPPATAAPAATEQYDDIPF